MEIHVVTVLITKVKTQLTQLSALNLSYDVLLNSPKPIILYSFPVNRLKESKFVFHLRQSAMYDHLLYEFSLPNNLLCVDNVTRIYILTNWLGLKGLRIFKNLKTKIKFKVFQGISYYFMNLPSSTRT